MAPCCDEEVAGVVRRNGGGPILRGALPAGGSKAIPLMPNVMYTAKVAGYSGHEFLLKVASSLACGGFT
jgi:hypothetical protein